jgi:hypothetical protein
MAQAFARGQMSERQANAAVAVIERETEHRVRRLTEEAARLAAIAAGVRVPTGTHEVTGVIVFARYSGGTHKILVVTDDGCRLWGTCPKAVIPNIRTIYTTKQLLHGRRVKFTAELAPKKGDDPLFGLFKRPRRAQVLDPSPSA